MSSSGTIHIVFNPVARAGRARSALEEARRLAGGDVVLHQTRAPLEAIQITRRLIREGADLIVAAGGDGTIHEVVNGFYTESGRLLNPVCRLGLLNLGTGQGLARSLGLPRSLEAQVQLWRSGKPCPVDIWRVQYRDAGGDPVGRLFINECQIGVGADVVRLVKKRHKWWLGRWSFAWFTLQRAFLGRAAAVQLRIDGQAARSEALFGLVLANGSHMGGGMALAPGADLSDGRLDILLIHRMTVLQRLINFSKVYSGAHLSSRFFSLEQGYEVRVECSPRQAVAADGEWLGYGPAVFSKLEEPVPLLME